MGQEALNLHSMAPAPDGTVRSSRGSVWGPLRVADRLRQAILPDPDAPVSLPAARARAKPRSAIARAIALVPRLVLGSICLLIVIAAGLFAFRQAYHDRIYPSVMVAGVDVGGLTPADAAARIELRAAEIEQGTITISQGGLTWTPTLLELGATVDVPGSTSEALALGREGDAASRLAFTGAILDSRQQAPLQLRLDPVTLGAWFDRADREIGQLAVNATIVMDGAEARIDPERAGRAIDRDAATRLVLDAVSSLRPVEIELPMRDDLPEITQAHLRPVQAAVEGMVSETVRASFEDRTWQLDGSIVVPHVLVDVAMEGDTQVVTYSIDIEGLAGTLRTRFGLELARDPVDAVLGWDNGVVMVEPSRDGVTIKAVPFAEAVAASFLGDHEPVEIPVLLTKPRVDGDNYDDLGIDELLGQGDSNFSYGVPGRDENVRLASAYLNHTLVPPGGEFSYNDAIGEVTADRGFQEALVVQGEGIGRDVGGGVCQVSTTVFRAALYAGMPITEWYQHTFRLPNYEYDGWPPGFDASILQFGDDPAEWPDFRFENYTDRWLLVQSYIEYPRVYVNIFGTSDGRTVDIDAWDISDMAFGFTRKIYDPNGSLIAERAFVSYFQG